MKQVMAEDIAEAIDREIKQPPCHNYKYLYLQYLSYIQEWVRTK